MAKRPSTAHSVMVHCSNCGEDYSSTYKRCPFCDERAATRPIPQEDFYEEDDSDDYDDYEDVPPQKKGGKRLASNTRGGGYGRKKSPLRIIGTVVELAIVVAAVCIVISIVRPLIHKGNVGEIPSGTPAPPVSTQPATPPVETMPGVVAPTATPALPTSSPPIPSTQQADSFTLSSSDFTLKAAGEKAPLRPAFLPAGTTGEITWSSSKPGVATVSESGVVVAVAPGNTTVTATMAGGYAKSCIVRCSWSGTAAPAPEGNDTPAGGTLKLNRADFTLSKAGETFRLKVSGTESNPTWSVSDNSIVTLSGDGTATAVAPGSCTVTAKVDGQTLTCIVRCTW